MNRSGGFSLVEMLVVVAVIGILAALAMPHFGKVHGAASAAKDQSNAQEIVSLYHSAQAMGLNFDGVDKLATIANVVAGGRVASGPFKSTYFGLPHLSREERDRAAVYIDVEGKALQYIGSSPRAP